MAGVTRGRRRGPPVDDGSALATKNGLARGEHAGVKLVVDVAFASGSTQQGTRAFVHRRAGAKPRIRPAVASVTVLATLVASSVAVARGGSEGADRPRCVVLCTSRVSLMAPVERGGRTIWASGWFETGLYTVAERVEPSGSCGSAGVAVANAAAALA